MKKSHDAEIPEEERDELAPEYRFDHSKAKPNRFAERMSRDAVVVVLDPDVAEVFSDSASVNSFLRSTIEAVERRPAKKVS